MRIQLRTIWIFVVVAALAVPALAQRRTPYGLQNELRVRIGLFEPDGESEYWVAKQIDFTGEPSDFEDVTIGVDYLRALNQRWGLLLSASGYEGQERQAYRFFETGTGTDIDHITSLDVGAFTAGLVFHLARRDARFVPYAGVGGGFYLWDLTENGDFIDFTTPDLEIFPAIFQDDGEALGWYWHAGLSVGLSRTWSFFAEFREHNAEDELGGDFEGACDALLDFGGFDSCDLELSGQEISAGLSVRF